MARTIEDVLREQLGGLVFQLAQVIVHNDALLEENTKLKAQLAATSKEIEPVNGNR